MTKEGLFASFYYFIFILYLVVYRYFINFFSQIYENHKDRRIHIERACSADINMLSLSLYTIISMVKMQALSIVPYNKLML